MSNIVDRLMYMPITKVEDADDDLGGVFVFGKVTDGHTLDAQRQITDAASFQKAAKVWARDWGNIRAQHNAQRGPVGVATEIVFDGDETLVGARIVDEEVCKLVKVGAYKGFSYGLIKDKYDVVRDAQAPRGRIVVHEDGMGELSLVDRPSHPEAKVVMVKMQDDLVVDLQKDDAATELTQAEMADAAIAIVRQIIASEAAESDDETWDLYTLVSVLQSLVSFKNSELVEAMSMAADAAVGKSAVIDLIKARGKNQKMLQTIHDSVVSMGASCGPEEKAVPIDETEFMDMLKKAGVITLSDLNAPGEDLTKAVRIAAGEETVTDERYEELRGMISELKTTVTQHGEAIAPAAAFLGGALQRKEGNIKLAQEKQAQIAEYERLTTYSDPAVRMEAREKLATLRTELAEITREG